MTIKYSQQDLKKNLIKQSLSQTNLYYSLVKKQGKTLSFLSNNRLLIYDDRRKILFYNNDYSNTPFRNNIPDPKNSQFTPLKSSTFKNPNQTNQIQVRYTGNNNKGQFSTIQWNFTCFQQPVTKKWIQLFEEEKNAIIEQLTGQKKAGFVHDTLLNLPLLNQKETILKPQEQVIKIPLQQQNKNVTNSRISNSKMSNSKINENNNNISNTKMNNNNYNNYNNNEMVIPQRSILESKNIYNSKNISAESKISLQKSINKQIQQPQSLIKYKHQNQSNIHNTHIRHSNINNKGNSIIKNNQDNDWNFIFLQKPHLSTILQFQKAALSAFKNVYERDNQYLKESSKEKEIVRKYMRTYQSDGLLISIANIHTKEAHLMKKQFRNYHFILQSCKNNIVVHVPMTALVECHGIISLVKAPITSNAQQTTFAKTFNSIRELERYTRVSNAILQKNIFYEVTTQTTSNVTKNIIYIDKLIQYLPINVEEQYSNSTLRPQFLLDNVMQLIPGGAVSKSNKQQWRLLSNVCEGLNKCIKQLSQSLSNQDTLWCQAVQLKEIFHSYGVNLKYLPKIYNQITNKHLRRYVQTVMAAKIGKQMINDQLLKFRKQNQKVNLQKFLQDILRVLIQGNTNISMQYWKQLSIRFKKQYLVPINNNEVIGGIFLNSIIKLLRIKCDISKLNTTKRIFKDQNIINPGFVIELQPKIKSYYKFTSQFIDKVKYACREEKKDEEIYQEIVEHLQLNHKALPIQYSEGSNRNCLMEYLSYYAPPPNMDSSNALSNIPIYDGILQEPPNSFSLKITKSYLNWAIKKDKHDDFKKVIEKALKITDFWFEENHLFHCQLYQLLSDYYASIGNGEESINCMKQSLSRCIRLCGVQSKLVGSKYYQLGQRQLKVGRKKQALENFLKAKMNMQTNKNDSINYPKLLMRFSTLNLNNGNIQGCIEGCLHAVRQFQQYDSKSQTKGLLTQGFKIKTFQVLSRAYQISGRKNDMREMALLVAKKFNKTKSQWVYEQLVRICLAAAIFKNPIQKSTIFSNLITKLLNQDQQIQSGKSLRQLINLSQTMAVMEKFIQKFQIIQKMTFESQSKKPITQDSKDFLYISKLILGVVGQDYIFGLISQKQYE